jgi:hypothetical protein
VLFWIPNLPRSLTLEHLLDAWEQGQPTKIIGQLRGIFSPVRGSDRFTANWPGSVALGLVQSPSAIDGGLRGVIRVARFFIARRIVIHLLEYEAYF